MAAGLGTEPRFMSILRGIVPDIIEPVTGLPLSWMQFNLVTKQLIVRNTPSNLELLEQNLEHFDERIEQVSIEAKFLTVNIADLKSAVGPTD